jgi:hypothetical protein
MIFNEFCTQKSKKPANAEKQAQAKKTTVS